MNEDKFTDDKLTDNKEDFTNAESMAHLQDRSSETLPMLAAGLDAMQAEANNGRGISSVQTLISYLIDGDLESAQSVAMNEWDKISSYPEIARLLIEAGIYTPVDFDKFRLAE